MSKALRVAIEEIPSSQSLLSWNAANERTVCYPEFMRLSSCIAPRVGDRPRDCRREYELLAGCLHRHAVDSQGDTH